MKWQEIWTQVQVQDMFTDWEMPTASLIDSWHRKSRIDAVVMLDKPMDEKLSC